MQTERTEEGNTVKYNISTEWSNGVLLLFFVAWACLVTCSYTYIMYHTNSLHIILHLWDTTAWITIKTIKKRIKSVMKKYILGWLKIALLEKKCLFANTQCHIKVEDWGCVGTLIRWEESFGSYVLILQIRLSPFPTTRAFSDREICV